MVRVLFEKDLVILFLVVRSLVEINLVILYLVVRVLVEIDLVKLYLVKELCTSSLVGRVLMKIDLMELFLVVRVLVDMMGVFLEKKSFAQGRWRRYLEMVKFFLGMRAQIVINKSGGDSFIMIREMLI